MEVLLHAQSLLQRGGPQTAAEFLEEHMARQPGDFRVAAALGRVYRRLQQPEKAAHWLRYSLQNRYVTPDLDEEDITYFGEAAEEEPALDLDHEYGVDTCGLRPANDDAPLEGDREEEPGSEAEAGRSSAPLTDIPDFDQQSELVEPKQDDEDIPSIEELENLQEDLSELFAEDDDEEDDGADDVVYVEPIPDDADYYDDENELADHLTHWEKAEGIAAEIAVEAGWLKKDIEILIEVLSYHCSHGKTRSAIRELLVEKEATPVELEILHDLRQLWGGGGYNRSYRRNKAEDGWPNVSWQLGLRLLRGLRVDSVDEVLLFVEDCFEEWGASPKQLNAFPIFTYYLDYILAHMERMSERCGQPIPSYIEYQFFDDQGEGYEEWYEPGFRDGYRIIT
ncbi:hypothetical protein RYH70_13790 [Alloalcanivorax xenomutans]|uniref:hypothetical protein n=1 Tax=Alloalcanivorax xenomutans TaxID=1094342 RepID=UPI002934B5A5|nr:hypothetical protein [Alloalcanivorax xenomutans]WOD27090.1 hypothetical protein RYH70_13790 [Alloalcanivorax xenomutans]